MTEVTAKILPFASPLERKLTAEHLSYFTDRGIKPAYVKRTGAFSEADGIVMPYRRPDGAAMSYKRKSGAVVPGFSRKRLVPALPSRKCVQPKGSDNHFYFAPLADPTESWVDVCADPTVDTYSAEGEAKAMALSRFGPTTAKGGCWSWRYKRRPIDDFNLIEWRGRTVRIVTDADAHTNLQVQIATIGEFAELRRRGAKPLIVVIPDLGDGKTGADDFIAAKGAKAFLALPALDLADEAFAEWGLAKEPGATDTGNAMRFVLQHGDRVRYAHEWKTWLMWDGVHWRRDTTENIWENARETVRRLYREAHECTDLNRRQDLAMWATESEGATRIEKMLRVARTDRHIAVSAEVLDAHPHLLTVLNGVIDLDSGELLDARPDWLLTKQIPVAFDPKAECPRFRRFVLEVMGNDPKMVAYLQRVIGYCLSGDTREQCFFIWHGVGANGKSTLLNVITALLGEFACTTRMETWVAQKRGAGGPSEDIARLRGARMVSAVESEEEHRLAESLIKEMSGQDRVSARKLFEASFEYVPQFKLIIVCNHKPTMRGDDPAVWWRVRLVPFECVFPVNEKNKKLIDRLKTELPGILRWALAGCLDWQKRGLAEPEKITKVTSEYRGASDVFQLFLDECCERGDHETTASRLYTVYTIWVKTNGHRAMSSTKLSLRLQDRGIKREKRSGEIYYTGLGVRTLWLKVAMESKST